MAGSAAIAASAGAPVGAATDVDVVVVGAGAAGLAATAELLKAGLTVKCIEARSRTGGRAVTDTTTFGVPFDRGAHWLHTRRRNPFVKIGKQLGFDVYDAPENSLLLEAGEELDDSQVWSAYARIERRLSTQAMTRQDKSLIAAVDPQDRWEYSAMQMIALSMARDPDEISILDWYSAEAGGDAFCHQGFGAIVRQNGASAPVTLNTPLKSVEVGPNQVELRTGTGKMTGRACVLTVPLGVLQSGSIKINPAPSGDLAKALNGFAMGTYNHAALMLHPGTIDLPQDTWVNRPMPQGSAPTGVLCNVSGTGLCILETSGSSGRALERRGKAAMVEFALEELQAIFGTRLKKALVKSDATRWGEDRYTLGCYSGARVGATSLRKHFQTPIADRLFLAGEHCHEGFQSTVAGAHLDGIRAANAVESLLS